VRVAVQSLHVVRPLQIPCFATHAPRTLTRRLPVEQLLELLRQHRILDQYSLLAIQPGRARIQVVAADKQRAAVGDESLGMQSRSR
jgi:hypothetical protein